MTARADGAVIDTGLPQKAALASGGRNVITGAAWTGLPGKIIPIPSAGASPGPIVPTTGQTWPRGVR